MKLKSLLAIFLTVMTVLPLIASCTGEPEQTTGEISENTETSDTLTEADTTVFVTDPETSEPVEDTTTAEVTTAPEDTTEEETTTAETTTAEETTTAGETTTAEETTTEKETTTAETTKEETTAPETKPPEQYGKASELYFRQVYGTGVNNDTPARYSFIEISNSSKYSVKLKGLAVYYYDAEAKKYVSANLPDMVIPASGSFLVRGNEAKGKQGAEYKATGERLSVKYYDLQWNITLDNKEIQLILADKGKSFGTSKASEVSCYAYFIGTQSVTSDKDSAYGITKNKAAYRNTKNDKFKLVDYKNAPASEVVDCAPMCLKGNVNGLSSAANVVTFSHKAGVYKDTISLTLKASSGFTIYYTTDGTDPRTNGTKYTGAIKLENTDLMTWGTLTKRCNTLNGAKNPTASRQIGAKVVKAYATNGKIKTQVETNTYFISDVLLSYDTLVVSMSMNPDDFLSSDKGIYHTQMADPFGTKMRRTMFTEIFETNGERVSASYTEMALNGNGSLGFNAKSIRVYFKDDADPEYIGNPSKLKYDIFKGQAKDGVTEYKRILLRNSGNDSSQTHLRDAYMQRLCKNLNVPVMAYRPSLLFINGEFWGVYNARERYDAKYFESHYGIPEEDFCMLESTSPLITGSWNTPYVVNDGNEGDEKPFHELVSYIERTDLSKDENFKYVSDRIDIDNMVDFFVGSMYLCNTDWPGNNIKVWRNKNANNKDLDTKWRFAFCDMDMGVGLATEINTNMFTHAINDNTVAGRIFNRMLKNEAFKNKFIDRFYECADTMFDASITIPILEEMYQTIKNIMPLHFKRWPGDGGSVSNFEAQINNVRYFMNNRKARALAHMEAFFNIQPKQLSVTFDEDALTVRINGDVIRSGYSVTLKSTERIALTATAKDGYTYTGIITTDSKGSNKTYSDTTVTLNVDGTMNVLVKSKKDGYEAEPAVYTGSRTVLALAADGTLYGWGNNEYGQLGMVSDTIKKPTAIFTNVKKAAVSMGGTESDAPMAAILTASGEVYTAGNNAAGQLGRTGNTFACVKLDLGFKAVDVSCGFDHMVIIAENGDMYGIGNNSYGQLGKNGFGGNVTKLQKFEENVKTAAAGRRHTIYIKDNGELYVFGDNRWNKFKAGASETLTDPLKLGDGFAFVSTGQHNCLAINNDGELFYIGWRSKTSFAAGEAAGQPVKIADGMKEAYIQDEHIIMLASDGKIYGYGLNNYNQISGDGQTKSLPEYITDGCIGGGAGTHYSAYIKADGSLYLFGNNVSGTIGNGSVSDSYVKAYKAINLK